MLAINCFVWTFLFWMPGKFFIEALRSELNGGEPDGICCCRTLSWTDYGCEIGTLHVQETKQCCKRLPSCNNRILGSFGAALVGDYKQTKNERKCQPNNVLAPKKIGVAIKIRKPGHQNWEYLSISNWYKVSAFRFKAYNLNQVGKGEKIIFALDVLHHGIKVEELSKEYSVIVGSGKQRNFRPDEIKFEETHMQKEYWLTVRYWKVQNEIASPAITFHRLLYAARETVCGVSFLQDSHRNCNGPITAPEYPLSKGIPGYALGVEYELVGAPLISTQSNNNIKPGTSQLQLDANMSSFVHVNGRPCTGECGKLKNCLWKKLGWSDKQKDAWNIIVDLSVGAMTQDQTKDALQYKGIPFEIVSPGPPHILVGQGGMQNAMNVLTAIHKMGAQAPLSAGLHLHVNTRNREVGSDIILSLKQIMAVIFSWARFQLIIDEILSPDRVGNYYAKGFYLNWGLEQVQANALRRMFNTTHKRLWKMTKEEDDKLDTVGSCNAVLGQSLFKWCEGYWDMPSLFHMKDNPEKFFQINVSPLGRFGTIEFRAGTATLDINRAARWLQFLVGFVHTFKNTEHSEIFFDDDNANDWNDLIKAQMRATPDELKKYMAGNVEDDFFEYFATDRPYEKEPGTGCLKRDFDAVQGIFG